MLRKVIPTRHQTQSLVEVAASQAPCILPSDYDGHTWLRLSINEPGNTWNHVESCGTPETVL